MESDVDQYSPIYYTCYITGHLWRTAILSRSRMNGMLISSCQKVISIYSPFSYLPIYRIFLASRRKGRICGHLCSFSESPFNLQFTATHQVSAWVKGSMHQRHNWCLIDMVRCGQRITPRWFTLLSDPNSRTICSTALVFLSLLLHLCSYVSLDLCNIW